MKISPCQIQILQHVLCHNSKINYQLLVNKSVHSAFFQYIPATIVLVLSMLILSVFYSMASFMNSANSLRCWLLNPVAEEAEG